MRVRLAPPVRLWQVRATTTVMLPAPRLLDGGEITHRVETELPCSSCALGGPDGRHLFLLCNQFEGVDQLTKAQARRNARICVTELPADW